MIYKDYPLGALPSIHDDRDFILPFAPQEIKEIELKYPFSAKDQGQTSMCVAFSLSEAREITESLQSGKSEYFSEGFIYANRQDTDYQGEGMFPREALKNLQRFGDVYRKDFNVVGSYPYVKEEFLKVKETLYKKAEPFKITSYYSVKTMFEVYAALSNNLPVLIVIPVYESFYKVKSDGIVTLADTKNEKLYGYHAMLITGIKKINNDFYYKVLNSWGEDFGDCGYIYIPSNYSIIEMWVITDDILPPKPDVKPEPKPQDNTNKFYRILLGVYLSLSFARNKLNQLIKQGYPTCYLVETKENNKTYYKVYYGKFAKIEDAREISSNMLKLGIPNTIKYE